jgi:aldehyde dehydrogenase (NAD+)
MANNTMYGLAGSVHTEQLPLALETAKHIKAGTVWINCHNLFDAAAGFGGFKQSGYGRDGGKEGLFEYVKPKWQGTVRIPKLDVNFKTFGANYTADRPTVNGNGEAVAAPATPGVDHTYKVGCATPG